jgi:uncharacterized protein (UPF0333 family)
MVFNLKTRAQATIEFLLLIMMMLIYLNVFVLSAQTNSMTAVNDTKKIILAENAIQKIKSTIQELDAFEGDSTKTITLFLDNDITIRCSTSTETGNKISFEVVLETSAESIECPNKVCNKEIELTTSSNIDCSNTTSIDGSRKLIKLKIQKSGTTITLEEAQ